MWFNINLRWKTTTQSNWLYSMTLKKKMLIINALNQYSILLQQGLKNRSLSIKFKLVRKEARSQLSNNDNKHTTSQESKCLHVGGCCKYALTSNWYIMSGLVTLVRSQKAKIVKWWYQCYMKPVQSWIKATQKANLEAKMALFGSPLRNTNLPIPSNITSKPYFRCSGHPSYSLKYWGRELCLCNTFPEQPKS